MMAFGSVIYGTFEESRLTQISSIIHWNKSRIPGGDPLEPLKAFGSVIYRTFE
jgi:hypothetical protein